MQAVMQEAAEEGRVKADEWQKTALDARLDAFTG
ncbi:hypothetical protein B2K_39905 [Paenibacillus mucilaginosus K02]|uniref:Uncharacterized protein n=1 Tax=Paenibacillus mucilaginosus K02 TaxID=997761 RepID=R9UQ17_9BACL|nr:hypothetical protein B2K_39905 [Paenibacillus mucilaginosus K02]